MNKLQKALQHGSMPYIITTILAWAGWVSISSIDGMIATAKIDTKIDVLTASVSDVRSDIKDYVLPRLGVDPKVKSYPLASTTNE